MSSHHSSPHSPACRTHRATHTPGDAHTASPGVPAPTCVLLATLPISMSWTGRGKIGTTKNTKMEFDDLSNRAIGCAIEVHRHLGPGRLESAYEPCLAHELSRHKIAFHLQLTQPVRYKDILLDCGYRIDVLVKNQLIFELKSIGKRLGIHEVSLLKYMKLATIKIGLLMNFNVTKLKDGMKRFML